MKYPQKLVQVQFGSRTLEMTCIADFNRLIDELVDEAERTKNEALLDELCPYFGTIWPSARALAQEILELGPRLRNKTVLELGCGLALPSMMAALQGAQVTATDLHPDVPHFLEINMERNKVSGIRYQRLDWKNNPESPGTFDYVIASDVLYEKEQADLIPMVVARTMKPDGTVLLADPARPHLQTFVDKMGGLGFEHEMHVHKIVDESHECEIVLLILHKRRFG